eukprot:TRINITY_DN50967_c0_g1_i1.p1 TRINITY_DN50967_c0_g1~~TRINITY_DN50967_c0_g1_i1.p1  ORF type:complete len:383 (-),score=29.39 TRINITY_DN50967_c0_g1_i1:152-1300(-)
MISDVTPLLLATVSGTPLQRAMRVQQRRRPCKMTFVLGAAAAKTGQTLLTASSCALASISAGELGGISSAVSAPLLSVIGLVFLEDHWHGSAFSLNLFKCALASSLFLMFVTLCSPGGVLKAAEALTWRSTAYLCASSLIGVVIGDNTWLLSLRLIGARRVLLIDSLKPFIAAGISGLLFGESTTLYNFLCMGCAATGTLIAALDRQSGSDGNGREFSLKGYLLAGVTVFLDVVGCVLIKQSDAGLGPWAMGGIRFGFAAIALALIAAVMKVLRKPTCKGLRMLDNDVQAKPWFEMPSQTLHAWSRAALGVLFVTVLNPVFFYHSLLRIPLGLCLTLSSLGPVISIPVVWLVKGERVTVRGTLGSILAVAGVIAFCNNVPRT